MAAAVQTQGIRIVRQLRTFTGHGIVQVKRLRPIADTLYRQCNTARVPAIVYTCGISSSSVSSKITASLSAS